MKQNIVQVLVEVVLRTKCPLLFVDHLKALVTYQNTVMAWTQTALQISTWRMVPLAMTKTTARSAATAPMEFVQA
jgi:hypothetical protein